MCASVNWLFALVSEIEKFITDGQVKDWKRVNLAACASLAIGIHRT